MDAKVPRAERDELADRRRDGDEVVAVPGIAEAPGWEGAVARRPREPAMTDASTHGVGEVLIDEDALQARIAELGAEISADYEGRDLLLVGVLKGAVFFMADLMRRLTVPCEIDFMAISSYGAATDSSGVVRILKDLDAEHRRPRRARRRGHHRLRAHALVPDAHPRRRASRPRSRSARC